MVVCFGRMRFHAYLRRDYCRSPTLARFIYLWNADVSLYTYWFDIPGDPNMHYLAIEGPSDVEDYNYIIDSYRLTK